MEGSRIAAGTLDSLQQQSGEHPARSVQPPTSMQYNEAGDQIYVPGTGWMDAGELFDWYLNDPSRLPADVDLSALHTLREQYEQPKRTADDEAAAPESNRESG